MHIQPIPQNWTITYDPYADFLQVYDQRLHKMSGSNLKKEHSRYYTLFFDKKNKDFLMLQVENVFDKFKKDITDMSRDEIISLLFSLEKNGTEKGNQNRK